MIRSFKIRIYPTKEQEQKMWEHIGACRFLWNWMIDRQHERYAQNEKHLSAFDMIRLITPLKNDGVNGWLYDISNATLQTVCRDLSKAYELFFRKVARYPKYKTKKKTRSSFPARADALFFVDDKLVNIEKVGHVRYKTDFNFPIGKKVTKFTNPRVKYVLGKWMLCFGTECENQAPCELSNKRMGIDLGVKELAVVAFEDESYVFHNINKSKKMRELEKEIKRVSRRISRKYEANKVGDVYIKTNNIKREEDKLRKLYMKQSNIRQNHIHQITHLLVSRLPCKVVMEDLNVVGLMKNRHISKRVQEQCFFEFRRQMEYKCEWYGIEIVFANRFFPSSKTCSGCGTVKHDLKLKDREYQCPHCGLIIDRDYNAAINLMKYIA